MYLTKIPKLLRYIYPNFLWRHETDEKVIYLTFDDGPTPEITDWVLAQLAAYQAQATFFVIGKNAKAHPSIIHHILAAGHVLGNHTQHHMNGRKATLNEYLDDFYEAQQTLTAITGKPTTLFRPPYGKIKIRQARPIQETHKVVMMDILAGDFDPDLSQKKPVSKMFENMPHPAPSFAFMTASRHFPDWSMSCLGCWNFMGRGDGDLRLWLFKFHCKVAMAGRNTQRKK